MLGREPVIGSLVVKLGETICRCKFALIAEWIILQRHFLTVLRFVNGFRFTFALHSICSGATVRYHRFLKVCVFVCFRFNHYWVFFGFHYEALRSAARCLAFVRLFLFSARVLAFAQPLERCAPFVCLFLFFSLFYSFFRNDFFINFVIFCAL